METKLTLLGKSDATIAVILDNLESCNMFPEIAIFNNFHFPIEHPFDNPRFKWRMIDKIEDYEGAFALGVTNAYTKRKLLDTLEVSKMRWMNIIHKTAVISSVANVANGAMINTFSVVGPYVRMGKFVTVAARSIVSHHVTLEDMVSVNPGCNISGHSYVGEGTVIGVGTTIKDHIKIGKNCIIGAGSVVVRDIPDNVIAYGNPCKPIRDNG
jgi:sugar O-acyltransferase (sialic acid O-acetyltransferase NeuD family)